MNRDIIKKIIDSGLVLVPKNGKVNVKGCVDKVYSNEEINIYQGDSVALISELSLCFCLDFDIKGLKEPADCDHAWAVWDRIKIIANTIFGNNFYCERTPSGGEHIIVRSEEKISLGSEQLFSVNGKCFIEVKSMDKCGILNVYPSKGYKQLSETNLYDLEKISVELVLSLVKYLYAVAERKEDPPKKKEYIKHKNNHDSLNASDFLIQELGVDAIMKELGYIKHYNNRWDLNTSLNPSAHVKYGKIVIDYQNLDEPKNIGNMLYVQRYGNDFKKFLDDYPKYNNK